MTEHKCLKSDVFLGRNESTWINDINFMLLYLCVMNRYGYINKRYLPCIHLKDEHIGNIERALEHKITCESNPNIKFTLHKSFVVSFF